MYLEYSDAVRRHSVSISALSKRFHAKTSSRAQGAESRGVLKSQQEGDPSCRVEVPDMLPVDCLFRAANCKRWTDGDLRHYGKSRRSGASNRIWAGLPTVGCSDGRAVLVVSAGGKCVA